jgi:hypothetical protein
MEEGRRIAAINPNDRTANFVRVRMGEMLTQVGDLRGARVRLQEALATAERMVAADSSWADAQSHLANVLAKVGDVERLAGRASAARRAYERSAAIYTRLIGLDATNAYDRWGLLEPDFRLAQMRNDAAALTAVVERYRQLGGREKRPYAEPWLDELETPVNGQ